MNHDFLIRSKEQSCGPTSSGLSRRQFIKRTGAASVATLVFWNATSQNASAYTVSFSFMGFSFTASFPDWASGSEPKKASQASEWWMKCQLPEKAFFGDVNGKLDADPVGWTSVTTVNGEQTITNWYRLYTQGFVRVNKVRDEKFGYNFAVVAFQCFGRWSMVPCSADKDTTVDPPADNRPGDGMNTWSKWYTWSRYAEVFCSISDGKITSYNDRETPGDTFNDGTKLWTELKDGGASVDCTFTVTHPKGGAGDPIPASVLFIAEQIA